jgi:hypothetical protein
MTWAKNGTTTLTGTADTIDNTFDSSLKFNVQLTHKLASGDSKTGITFDDSSSSDYARRMSTDGLGDVTGTSISVIPATLNAGVDQFDIGYFINITTEEKLYIGFGVSVGVAGAGNAPRRNEVTFKQAQTSTQIASYTITNDTTGDYAVDTNVSNLGTD